MVGISQDSVLGIVFSKGSWDFSSDDEVLMFLREMGLGHGPAFTLVLAVDALFVPISDECAWVRRKEPCALGAFLL